MTNETILIVDDEPDIRDIVEDILRDEEYEVFSAGNAKQADTIFQSNKIDLVLLDIWMPEMDGISLLKSWSEKDLKIPVVMISGHGTVDTAVEAIRYGAYDFLEKPLSTGKLLVTVRRALQNRQLSDENNRLRQQLKSAADLVGKSTAISQLREQISRAAKTDSWIMVDGEPGSGKGVVVQQLHLQSSRAAIPLVDISFSSLPSNSIAKQLFGFEEKGNVQAGRLEQAAGGILLLDEIGDLDSNIQGVLYHAIESGYFTRVGGYEKVKVDSRIFCTSHSDLRTLVKRGRFRQDLYYRLNVIPLHVPPLREHKEDIPELVNYSVNWMVEQESLHYRLFTTAALNVLREYHWPGNIRELKNVIQRLLILDRGEEVSREEVELALGYHRENTSADVPNHLFDYGLRDARDQFEKMYFEHHLDRASGNMTNFAQTVGMERTHLYRKLKALGIDPKNRRSDS